MRFSRFFSFAKFYFVIHDAKDLNYLYQIQALDLFSVFFAIVTIVLGIFSCRSYYHHNVRLHTLPFFLKKTFLLDEIR